MALSSQPKRRPSRPAFLILGAGGRLGGEFLRQLGGNARGLNHRQLDLADADALRVWLRRQRPQIIVNCAAFNYVDRAERQRAAALRANFTGPGLLAGLALEIGARLVHFSTDYVFGADHLDRPRTEADVPAPLNFYGYSKLLGEQAVQRANPHALVLRVAHLYGGHTDSPGRGSLVERFLERARHGQPIHATHGQMLNPTAVEDIVAATLRLLSVDARGLVHLTGGGANQGACSAEAFAQAVLEYSGVPGRVEVMERDPRPVRRAPCTVLANHRLAQLGLPPMPDWRASLRAHLQSARPSHA